LIVTAGNYSAIANSHTLQFSRAYNWVFSVCCVHRLSGNGFQQCPLLPCSRSYRLATVPQLSTLISTPLHCTVLYSESESESESELLYDWQFTAYQFVLATSPLRLTTSNFFQLNACFHSPYVTSPLTRGRICRLQLLLVLATAVIPRFGSRETHDHILLSQIRDVHNLEGQVPVFICHRNRVAQLYPQALGSLFVVSYNSQGYGGGIRTRLHTAPMYLCTALTRSVE
jgi:hypothetical protein